MHPDTPMGVASCDKPWEEAAIHQLALHGRIDLNASVFRVLKIKPAGPVVDNRMYDITFNHLLEHKAGWQGEPLNRANQAYEAARDRARRLRRGPRSFLSCFGTSWCNGSPGPPARSRNTTTWAITC